MIIPFISEEEDDMKSNTLSFEKLSLQNMLTFAYHIHCIYMYL